MKRSQPWEEWEDEQSRQQEQQVQRPWGRNKSGVFEKKQRRPELLVNQEGSARRWGQRGGQVL